MPKVPNANLAHLGAAVDAIVASNAMLFSMLASPEHVEAAAKLFDQLAASPVQSPGDEIRFDIFGLTAQQLRGIAKSGVLPRRSAAEVPGQRQEG
ncbi:hypothetical protein [Stenotrophomonas maltophilia]|uniref:hypothetical protein n=1 Tax=Stenotrophomonas maltophilia TaxID=40324 RepID=UPI003018A573